MKFKIVITILFVIIIASFAYDNFYTTNMISATYRYDFDNAVPEGPHRGDILILKENGILRVILGAVVLIK